MTGWHRRGAVTSSTKQIHEVRELNGRTCDVYYKDFDAKISFIVPIYNAAYTLEWALGSLFAQSCDGDVEIVCVDDGSTDDSRKIIDRFAQDPRVVIVSHRKNAGYGAAMNDGIAVARGAWIGILEPDDYILPGMAAELMKVAEGHDCDIVKSPYIREVRDDGVPRGDTPREHLQCSYRYRIHPKTEVFTITDPGVVHVLRHHPSIWSAIYRKGFLEENDIKFHEYPGAGWADNEFFYDTLLRGRICYVDEPFYVYREETLEEATSFDIKNKTLPFDRWQSMADIIERLGITDEGVLKSHISKGFTYFNGAYRSNGEDPEVIAAAHAMFDRMDPELVANEVKLNPSIRERFATYRGVRVKSSRVRYGLSLVNEFIYRSRSNGLDYAMRCVKEYL